MSESEQIKQAFTRLRDFGFIVFNFNSHKANNKGLAGHPDWLFITPKLQLVYVEVKIGSDKLSSEQQRIINRLAQIMGLPYSRVYVFVCKTGAYARKLSDDMLANNL